MIVEQLRRTMKLKERFEEFIKVNDLFHRKDMLLLAVSGGVDSVVLCELCQQSGYDFIIAHCNFQLRGEESERDEQFVRNLAAKYNAAILVKRFDTAKYAEEKKVSIQVAARELRYEWFGEIIGGWPVADGRWPMAGERTTNNDQRSTASYILTAHHLDDNIETSLMNFFKGTGIAGLRGMLPKQEKIIRSLLFARKEELLSFAKENNLAWVEDRSNRLDKYSRNYFRNQVIPLIEKIYPETENNLADNLQRFRDTEILYVQAIEKHKKDLLEHKGNEVYIPVLKLKKSIPLHSIVYEIIKEYQFTPHQTKDVIHLLDAESGKYVQSVSHRIIKNRKWLIISPLATPEAETILIEKGERNVPCSMFHVHLSLGPTTKLSAGRPATSSIAELDASDIIFPLLLRRWKQGDYFYPLGMRKKKKLARFFIDQKLSKTDKEKIWVLESNKKILWVIGYRIDERFKITALTKEALRITISSPSNGDKV
jgi:tRNA(Ile)-lysidine synthase